MDGLDDVDDVILQPGTGDIFAFEILCLNDMNLNEIKFENLKIH